MASTFLPQNPQKIEPVIAVSALNQAVAQHLERNFPLMWVSGEISNFTRATSGHWYFTLKDSAAQVRAVMFRGRAQYADFIPREGDKVEVRALVGLYAPRGDYQINVEAIRRAGVGNLYEAFLQLKAKLAGEGLFNTERKKTFPAFPQRIGIVTSPNAAALRDVITTLRRRVPHIEVRIYPCPVQGEGAATKIASAIALAEAENHCELLIVCRGGGSIEDLWAFNEEILARTIAHCTLPIISAVGHETDFTIADFVADLRAPTPTAAAEMAATSRADWLATLSHWQTMMQRQMRRQLDTQTQQLDWTAQRLLSPRSSLAAKRQQILHCAQSLRYAAYQPIQSARNQVLQQQAKIAQRKPNSLALRQQLEALSQQLSKQSNAHLKQQAAAITALKTHLEMLNPQRTLERGYVILRHQDGDLVRAGSELHNGQRLSLRTAIDVTEFEIQGRTWATDN